MTRITVDGYAAFRRAIACLVLLDIVIRCQDFMAHYVDSGIFPVDLLWELPDSFRYATGAHVYSGSVVYQASLFVLLAASAAMVLLGRRQQQAAFCCWFLLCSLHNRNPLLLHRADDLLRMLVFWMSFIDDAAIQNSHDGMQHSRLTQHGGSISSNPILAGLPVLALKLQIPFTMLCTIIARDSRDWMDGSALYYALNFAPMRGSLSALFSGLSRSWIITASQAIFLLEAILPLCLLSASRTLRWIAICGLTITMLLFATAFAVGLFPWVVIASLLLYLPNAAPFSNFSFVVNQRGRIFVAAALLIACSHSLCLSIGYNAPLFLKYISYPLRLDNDWRVFHNPPRLSYWFALRLADADRGGTVVVSASNLESGENRLGYRWRRFEWTLASLPPDLAENVAARYALYLARHTPIPGRNVIGVHRNARLLLVQQTTELWQGVGQLRSTVFWTGDLTVADE